jgi:hypothetical protein
MTASLTELRILSIRTSSSGNELSRTRVRAVVECVQKDLSPALSEISSSPHTSFQILYQQSLKGGILLKVSFDTSEAFDVSSIRVFGVEGRKRG